MASLLVGAKTNMIRTLNAKAIGSCLSRQGWRGVALAQLTRIRAERGFSTQIILTTDTLTLATLGVLCRGHGLWRKPPAQSSAHCAAYAALVETSDNHFSPQQRAWTSATPAFEALNLSDLDPDRMSITCAVVGVSVTPIGKGDEAKAALPAGHHAALPSLIKLLAMQQQLADI